jgi:signal transduction histidine kinase
VVRVLAALLGAAGGLGVLLYLFWWLTIPSGDPQVAADQAREPALARLAPRLRLSTVGGALHRRDVLIGVGALAAALLLVASRQQWDWHQTWIIPAVLALAGLALGWSQVDSAISGQADGQAAGGEAGSAGDGSAAIPQPVLLRLLGGLALVAAGVVAFVGQDAPSWAMLQVAAAVLAVLVGFGLVLAPWWVRLARELGDSRAARAREAERADIAAHLHDSVLQTLALIRAQAGDADAVAHMARAQERELREWLYTDRKAAGTSLAAELRTLAGEVEDAKIGKPGATPAATIEVVIVGDCLPDDATTALLGATREALVNAVAHGRPPVTVYAEITGTAADVFIRDRGDGFDLTTIDDDRLGVRESIIGRMRRRNGTATVTSRPSWGTEIHLHLPRTAAPPLQPTL